MNPDKEEPQRKVHTLPNLQYYETLAEEYG